MKKTFWIIPLFLLIAGIKKSEAQVHVDISVGARPVIVERAPVVREVTYYYLPEEDVYYYVPAKRYYYHHQGRWVSAPRYRNCDVYRTRRVAVYEDRPYMRHSYYSAKYKGKGHHHKGKGKKHK